MSERFPGRISIKKMPGRIYVEVFKRFYGGISEIDFQEFHGVFSEDNMEDFILNLLVFSSVTREDVFY